MPTSGRTLAELLGVTGVGDMTEYLQHSTCMNLAWWLSESRRFLSRNIRDVATTTRARTPSNDWLQHLKLPEGLAGQVPVHGDTCDEGHPQVAAKPRRERHHLDKLQQTTDFEGRWAENMARHTNDTSSAGVGRDPARMDIPTPAHQVAPICRKMTHRPQHHA